MLLLRLRLTVPRAIFVHQVTFVVLVIWLKQLVQLTFIIPIKEPQTSHFARHVHQETFAQLLELHILFLWHALKDIFVQPVQQTFHVTRVCIVHWEQL